MFRLETEKTRKNKVFSKQFKYSDIDPIHLFWQIHNVFFFSVKYLRGVIVTI